MRTIKQLLISIAISFAVYSFNQTLAQQPESLVSHYKLNFAIPDLPAFKALDNEPSKILRPSTPEAFSTLASEFYHGNELIIPKSVGVELSPFLLINSNRLTLSSYQKKSILYSTRISLGSFRNDQNASTISLGVRFSLIDRGDMKNDNTFLKTLTSLLKADLRTKESIRDDYLKQMRYTEEQYATDSIIFSEVERAVKSQLDQSIDIDKKIERLKEKYKENNWNAEKLDIAFALAGYSNDSLAKNVKYKSTAFWITWALPVKKFGQLLLGSHVYSYKDFENNSTYTDLYLNSRLYLGTNRIKGFAEMQYAFQQKEKIRKLFYDLGAEINVSDGIWLDFYSGVENLLSSDKSSFISSFRIRFTLPENFKN